MRHGSLFSGIGGFDLAAEWMGWENVFHCEWNPFGQKILNHYWPQAESFGDITKTDFTKYHGSVEIISGGFPCQPYSSAGKRLGKEDERHLWPEMLRAIREIAPRWVVGENVRGLTNWNGGLVFDEVCTDLENLGYQVAPYLIPACGVNAPHKRERIWFVAYAASERGRQQPSKNCGWKDRRFDNNGEIFNASDTNCRGLERTIEVEWDSFNVERKSSIGNASDTNGIRGNEIKWQSERESNVNDKNCLRNDWQNFPTQSPICSGDDGIPTKLDGITFSKWRNESIKGYGNAVVPQVVFEIFKAIETYERNEVNKRRAT